MERFPCYTHTRAAADIGDIGWGRLAGQPETKPILADAGFRVAEHRLHVFFFLSLSESSGSELFLHSGEGNDDRLGTLPGSL